MPTSASLLQAMIVFNPKGMAFISKGCKPLEKYPKTRLALRGRNRQIYNMDMSVKSCKNDDITFNIMKNIYIVKFICFMSPFQGSLLWWHFTRDLHPLLINSIPLGFKRFSSQFKFPFVYQFKLPLP